RQVPLARALIDWCAGVVDQPAGIQPVTLAGYGLYRPRLGARRLWHHLDAGGCRGVHTHQFAGEPLVLARRRIMDWIGKTGCETAASRKLAAPVPQKVAHLNLLEGVNLALECAPASRLTQ